MRKKTADSSNYDIFRLRAIASGYSDDRYGAMLAFASTVKGTSLQLHHYKMLKLMCSGDFSLMNVCRQCGTTHMLALYVVFRAIAEDNTSALFVSSNLAMCKAAIEESIRVISHINEETRLCEVEYPTNIGYDPSIRFSNCSRITFRSYRSQEAIYDAYDADVTLFDSCAYFSDDKQFRELYWYARSGAKETVCASTPYQKKGLFWEMCNTARENIRHNGSCDRYLEISGEEVFGKKRMEDIAWSANRETMKSEFENEFIG